MLALAGMVVAITGAVAVVRGILVGTGASCRSCIIGLSVWGIGMFMALKVERLKKEHDLVTYRELVAFTKGEPIDRDNPKSRRARKHRFLKGAALVLLSACVGRRRRLRGFHALRVAKHPGNARLALPPMGHDAAHRRTTPEGACV